MISLILGNWRSILVGLVVFSVVGFFGRVMYQNASLKRDLSEANGTIQILRDNNDMLVSSINEKNQALKLLSDQTQHVKQDMDKFNKAVQRQTATLDAALRAVAAEKEPSTCEESIEYLVDAALEMNK